jgi:prolyl 4-hydroxylase
MEDPILKLEDRKDAVFQSVNMEFPNVQKGCSDPPLYAVKNFLSEEECKTMIDLASPSLIQSVIVDSKDYVSDVRTSNTYYYFRDKSLWLAERVSKLLNIPIEQQEYPQITRYVKGQFYKAHYDHFDLSTENGRKHIEGKGQRIATVLIYLNTPPGGGGGTNFKKMGFRVKPSAGSALIFFPATLDGRYDPLTLHEAEEAIGEKWVCQIWVRQNSFNY